MQPLVITQLQKNLVFGRAAQVRDCIFATPGFAIITRRYYTKLQVYTIH